MISQLEKQFMEMSISHMRKSGKQFIEVNAINFPTVGESARITLNKSFIVGVSPSSDDEANAYILMPTNSHIGVLESYDEIINKL